MRRLKFIPMLLAMGLVLATCVSCDLLGKLVKVKIDTHYIIDLPISLENALSESHSTVLSLADDPELDDYLNLLTKIDINSFTVSVTDYTGTDAVYDLELGVDGQTFFYQADVDIPGLYAQNKGITINDSAALKNVANNLLKNKKARFDGTATNKSSAVTADFNLHLVIVATVTANPLK